MEIIKEKIVDKFSNIKSGIIGIIGENGSGKTKLLNNLYSDYLNKNDHKKIGYVKCSKINSNTTLYNYLNKILEEKKYSNDKEKRINDSLLMVGLLELKNEKIQKLSHSEMILLNLASILIYNPKVLLIDEPFIKLDDENLKKVLHLLRLLKTRYKKQIVIVTNNIDVLHKIVDYIFVLKNEKLVLEGDKYEVFSKVDELNKLHILSPKVVDFSNTILKNKKIKIGYRDEINDLIKDIYRYIK